MSPERGDTGDWKNYRLWRPDRRRGSKLRRKYFKHGTSDKDGNGCRHLFDSCYPVKTKAQDIQRRKQAVRPRWKRREGPALERGCTSTFLFLGRSWEASCLFCRCPVYVFVFPKLFFSQVNLISKAFSRDADKSLMYATGGQAFSRLPP